MTEAEIFCASGPSDKGLGEETYFTFGDGSRAFQDANGRRSLLPSVEETRKQELWEALHLLAPVLIRLRAPQEEMLREHAEQCSLCRDLFKKEGE